MTGILDFEQIVKLDCHAAPARRYRHLYFDCIVDLLVESAIQLESVYRICRRREDEFRLLAIQRFLMQKFDLAVAFGGAFDLEPAVMTNSDPVEWFDWIIRRDRDDDRPFCCRLWDKATALVGISCKGGRDNGPNDAGDRDCRPDAPTRQIGIPFQRAIRCHDHSLCDFRFLCYPQRVHSPTFNRLQGSRSMP